MAECKYWSNDSVDLYVGDARRLDMIEDASVHCVVTSPPYWGLRDYGIDGGIGNEPTIREYTDNIVAVGREVRRVLRDDGTFWLNLGDSYSDGGRTTNSEPVGKQATHRGSRANWQKPRIKNHIPPKNLIGLPWRAAFALQDDGWILRSAIVWHKPNPMPESVKDRPTSSYEMIFLLTKQKKYFFDADAIRTAPKDPKDDSRRKNQASWDHAKSPPSRMKNGMRPLTDKQRGHSRRHAEFNDRWDSMSKEEQQIKGANARNVWKIATQPRPDAHFATFPDELPRRCILAGTSEHGVCGECGAPFERVVERTITEPLDDHPYQGNGQLRSDGSQGGNGTDHSTLGGQQHKIERTERGWRPACDHEDAPRVPATILDPFIGSGTTASVAQALGRRAIGVDMKEEYLAIAQNRIESGKVSFR